MKTIIPIIPTILNVIGKQPNISSNKYVWSVFTVKTTVKEGDLVYNTFTGSLILLEQDDDCLDFLINNWFLVSVAINEVLMVNRVRDSLRSQVSINGISTYTIFPTTDCNARCYYCFEKGRKKQYMSNETALSAARFILNHSNHNDVTIRWFGGEPLCNTRAVDIICDTLIQNNIVFSSKMASNCLSFNKDLVKHAVTTWNLRMVQVAIDGTEITYNKVKSYNYNNNAFQLVLSNIHELLNNGINVVIRLNFDNNIIDDQIRLVDDVLSNQFSNCDNLFVYSHPLTEAMINNSTKGREELFNKQKQLENKISEHGFSQPRRIPRDLKLFRCIADDRQSVTILPSGCIGLCEHYTEERTIGDVLCDVLNYSRAKGIREYCENTEECHKCFYYPQCIRLKCCPEAAKCFSEYRQFRMDKLKTVMISEYESAEKRHISFV